MDIGHQIQESTDQWAADLGDKVPVEMWIWCVKEPGKKSVLVHLSNIGTTGDPEICRGYGATLTEARLNANREWDASGHPTQETMAERRLAKEAERLGFRLEKIAPATEVRQEAEVTS